MFETIDFLLFFFLECLTSKLNYCGKINRWQAWKLRWFATTDTNSWLAKKNRLKLSIHLCMTDLKLFIDSSPIILFISSAIIFRKNFSISFFFIIVFKDYFVGAFFFFRSLFLLFFFLSRRVLRTFGKNSFFFI